MKTFQVSNLKNKESKVRLFLITTKKETETIHSNLLT